MSASPFVCPKVEAAFASYLLDNVTGLEHAEVNEDGAQSRRTLPCVECVCQSSQFDAPPSGSHIAQATIMVRANADDTTDAAFAAQVKAVWDALLMSDLANSLSSATADFHCDGVAWQSQSWQIVGRSWVAEMNIEVHCAGQSIPSV